MTATAIVMARGETLGGYRVLEVVGIGGMAIVYRAEQLSLGRQVALKVLSPELSRDEAFRERFRREGKNVASLDHPNVVTVHDSGEVGGRLFLAMRFVEGSTLADRMREGALPGGEALSILRPIADALDAAHALGLVHRDVKPQNILLSDRGHPYLADFGIAKGAQTRGLTVTGGFVGSFNYAAPEQALGRPTTSATDVYALTAVLFQCLTGQVPYPRDTDAGVLHAHVNEPPPTVVPAPHAGEFNEVIARGMAKAPADRYQSPSELLRDAETVIEALGSEQLSAVPVFRPAAPGDNAGESTTPPSDLSPTPATADMILRPAPAAALPATTNEVATAAPAVPTSTAAEVASHPPIAPPAPARATAGVLSKPPADVLAPASGATEIVPVMERRAERLAAEATAADRRRAPDKIEPAAAKERPRRLVARRGLMALVAAALALCAIAVVLALTSGGRPAERREITAGSGGLSVTFGTPWARTSSAGPASFALVAPLTLSSGPATLAAGALGTSAAIPGGPPPGLVNRFGPPARSAAAQVAGTEARSYTWTLAGGRGLVAYVVATPRSDLAILCVTAGDSSLRPRPSCVALAASARLVGVQPLAPGPDKTLTGQLNAILQPVAAARRRLAGLGAHTLGARLSGANALATGDGRAASAISSLGAPPRYGPAVTRLTTALSAEGRAFAALAGAAKSNSRSGYARASARVSTASRQVDLAAQSLRADQLLVATLSTLRLPGLPPPPPARKAHASPAVSSSGAGFTQTQPTYTPPTNSVAPTTTAPSRPSYTPPTTTPAPTRPKSSSGGSGNGVIALPPS